jgi:hypothetical protein
MPLKELAHRKLFLSSCADLFRAYNPASGRKQAWLAVTSLAMTMGDKRGA